MRPITLEKLLQYANEYRSGLNGSVADRALGLIELLLQNRDKLIFVLDQVNDLMYRISTAIVDTIGGEIRESQHRFIRHIITHHLTRNLDIRLSSITLRYVSRLAGITNTTSVKRHIAYLIGIKLAKVLADMSIQLSRILRIASSNSVSHSHLIEAILQHTISEIKRVLSDYTAYYAEFTNSTREFIFVATLLYLDGKTLDDEETVKGIIELLVKLLDQTSSEEDFEHLKLEALSQRKELLIELHSLLRRRVDRYSLIEAPTGTGKSYAYLIPTLVFLAFNRLRMFALNLGEKIGDITIEEGEIDDVYISTGTLALQDQLENDLKRILRALTVRRNEIAEAIIQRLAEFREAFEEIDGGLEEFVDRLLAELESQIVTATTIKKGQQNYICLQRVNELLLLDKKGYKAASRLLKLREVLLAVSAIFNLQSITPQLKQTAPYFSTLVEKLIKQDVSPREIQLRIITLINKLLHTLDSKRVLSEFDSDLQLVEQILYNPIKSDCKECPLRSVCPVSGSYPRQLSWVQQILRSESWEQFVKAVEETYLEAGIRFGIDAPDYWLFNGIYRICELSPERSPISYIQLKIVNHKWLIENRMRVRSTDIVIVDEAHEFEINNESLVIDKHKLERASKLIAEANKALDSLEQGLDRFRKQHFPLTNDRLIELFPRKFKSAELDIDVKQLRDTFDNAVSHLLERYVIQHGRMILARTAELWKQIGELRTRLSEFIESKPELIRKLFLQQFKTEAIDNTANNTTELLINGFRIASLSQSEYKQLITQDLPEYLRQHHPDLFEKYQLAIGNRQYEVVLDVLFRLFEIEWARDLRAWLQDLIDYTAELYGLIGFELAHLYGIARFVPFEPKRYRTNQRLIERYRKFCEYHKQDCQQVDFVLSELILKLFDQWFRLVLQPLIQYRTAIRELFELLTPLEPDYRYVRYKQEVGYWVTVDKAMHEFREQNKPIPIRLAGVTTFWLDAQPLPTDIVEANFGTVYKIRFRDETDSEHEFLITSKVIKTGTKIEIPYKNSDLLFKLAISAEFDSESRAIQSFSIKQIASFLPDILLSSDIVFTSATLNSSLFLLKLFELTKHEQYGLIDTTENADILEYIRNVVLTKTGYATLAELQHDLFGKSYWNARKTAYYQHADYSSDVFSKQLSVFSIAILQLPTVFDYPNQLDVWICLDCDRGLRNSSANDVWLARLIENFKQDLKHYKKFLVLSTSYQEAYRIANTLRKLPEFKDIQLFVQTNSKTISTTIQQFKRTRDPAILIGTEVLWKGISIPGRKVVAITRAPFNVPSADTEKIRQYILYLTLKELYKTNRIDEIRSMLANMSRLRFQLFNEYDVPMMLQRLRQGIGRAIRTKRDKARVEIYDTRILKYI